MQTMPTKTIQEDGGYYAVKGFLYQYDKTILEILNNPDSEIKFEQTQDIDYEDYVIQIKHKETQEFYNSKISKPILQLIDLFAKDQNKKFILYCHFKDMELCQKVLNVAELDKILGAKKNDYTLQIKEKFIGKFILEFSNNYEEQFSTVIEIIKEIYSLPDRNSAIYYHSIIRTRLFQLAIKEREQRFLRKADLDEYISTTDKTIFYLSYSKYLENVKYESLLKREFFTQKTVNLRNVERLFVIDVDTTINMVDIYKIIGKIITTYFKLGKSPAPYICLRNISLFQYNRIKQDLIDLEITFTDGTYFNGDRFRLDYLVSPSTKENQVVVKIINEDQIEEVCSGVRFKEHYHFFMDTPHKIETEYKNIHIQIKETQQITNIL
ncbi:hypothetical protein BVG16_28810 [Paenibacillus selenitireducens]|uniref:DUF4297 domain-containing protein n=1 Tax=Paenibacillus selenitireducens TaxID=1324314 RepID=A0A1T2X0Y4_9BACL|nr:hypothetical protein [Paenibacillus selenitireducens]OPA73465.1 hypothetical protein BVG16_28810 [Paenibacillus selenitireducens]